MKVTRIVHRNRRIPNRADGYLFLTIEWPGGSIRERSLNVANANGFKAVRRLFRRRFQDIPFEQTEFARAKVYATIRSARGGVRRIVLASWKGEESINSFFNKVKDAWGQLAKEADDETQRIPDEILFNEDK
jgi:hypothetical protein